MSLSPTADLNYRPPTGSLKSPIIPAKFLAQQNQNKLGKFVQSNYQAAVQYRSGYDVQWPYFYDLMFGKHYQSRRIQKGENWRAYLAVNYIHATAESIMSVLMDSHPKISLAATAPSQSPYVGELQAAIDAIYNRRKVLGKIIEAYKNALTYGNGYLKCVWNPYLANGKGDIEIAVVPSEYLYVNSSATCLEDAQLIFEVKPVPLSYIKQKYPDKAKLVRSDSANRPSFRDSMTRGSYTSSDAAMPFRWMSPVGDDPKIAENIHYSSPPYKTASHGEDWVTLIECWAQDATKEVVEIPVTYQDPVTQQWVQNTFAIERNRYPHGRLVTMAGGVILQDIPNPYPCMPYVAFRDICNPSTFYWMGEVELLKDQQIELNKRRSQLIDFATLTGNCVWILDRNSGVNPSKITNRPGLVITKSPGSEVKRDPPPAMPPWMFQMTDMPVRDMNLIAGVGQQPSGQAPRGVRSAAGFEAAQNVATTRTRFKGHTFEETLEDLGRIMIALIQRFYTTPRMVRVTDKTGQEAFTPFDGRNIRGDWDIKVESAATTSVTQAARMQQAIQLFQLGILDARAVLETCNWPGYEEVLRRKGEQFMDPPNYPGYPGMPVTDRTHESGYSQAVMFAPPAPPPGPGGSPPPGGHGHAPPHNNPAKGPGAQGGAGASKGGMK